MDDVLSRLIVRAEERGLFEGFLVGKNRTRELQSCKQILLVFGHLSWLRIDLNKNTLELTLVRIIPPIWFFCLIVQSLNDL